MSQKSQIDDQRQRREQKPADCKYVTHVERAQRELPHALLYSSANHWRTPGGTSPSDQPRT